MNFLIISGEAIVDESAVTGEYVPHIKKIGSEVYSGTLVKNGNIVINAVAVDNFIPHE